ncbi:MAG: hypothetical protein JST04_07295 [Bdellovibrionales bacterium]|nr:hypothetical protein [Bdellovibrionales bacterium]
MRTLFALLGAMLISANSATAANVVPYRSPRAHSSVAKAAFNLDTAMRRAKFEQVDTFPNSLCRAAYVFEFQVLLGLKYFPVNADYCELPETRVPAEVASVLARIREIHVRYAEALGVRPENLFGSGVRVHLGQSAIGPLKSGTLDEVEIDLFKDGRAVNFPDKIYAHELTHWLSLEGMLGRSVQDIESVYLFNESFPDLVSSYVNASTRIDFTDASVRSELTFGRDGSPVKSMNSPLSEFHLARFRQEPLDLCAKLKTQKLTANEKGMCSYFRADSLMNPMRRTLFPDVKEKLPTKAELAAPFVPEKCLLHYLNGTTGLDACYKSALGPVLISFVRTIESLLGDRPVASLYAAIETAAARPDYYVCEYTGATAKKVGTETATVSFPSFVRVFQTIREGLTPGEQVLFDRAWSDHGLDAWSKLERFDRETTIRAFAYQVLARQNSDFATENKCFSTVPALRGSKCASKCAFVPAPAEAP